VGDFHDDSVTFDDQHRHRDRQESPKSSDVSATIVV
jgi:hypothetical protein